MDLVPDQGTKDNVDADLTEIDKYNINWLDQRIKGKVKTDKLAAK